MTDFPSKETKALADYLASTGILHRVTSINSGKHATNSYHYKNLAVDFAGPTPGRDTPALMAVFNAFLPVADTLAELIYANAPFNIKNGKRVPRYAESIHHDHVHAAVKAGWHPPIIKIPIPDYKPVEKVTVVDRAVTWDITDYLDCPTGGAWLLARDGGVFSVGGAPSKQENIPIAHPDYWEHRQASRFEPVAAGKIGYTVVSADGAKYGPYYF